MYEDLSSAKLLIVSMAGLVLLAGLPRYWRTGHMTGDRSMSANDPSPWVFRAVKRAYVPFCLTFSVPGLLELLARAQGWPLARSLEAPITFAAVPLLIGVVVWSRPRWLIPPCLRHQPTLVSELQAYVASANDADQPGDQQGALRRRRPAGGHRLVLTCVPHRR